MADDEQFSLCWNNFNSNLSAGFHESLCRGDLVDVTLAAEGQLVKAHRLVLSVCSPYFRKMFTQMPANQHAFVFLKDVSHAALKDLIQFMYCGEVNVKQDALPAFISTAEALQIKGLTETGDSTPAPQQTHHQPAPPSPVKEMPPLVASTPITLVHQSPRQPTHRVVQQRQRQQTYKTLDSEGSSDEKVIIHQMSQKRPAPKILSPASAPAIKRVKQQQQIQQIAQTATKSTADPLESSAPIQIITSQSTTASSSVHPETKSIAGDTEFIDLPDETINPKTEPEFEEQEEDQADQQEQLQHEMEQESENDQDQQYAEDNNSTYGSIKYDESYFATEEASGGEVKAGVSTMSISGVNESYATEGGEPSTTEAQATTYEEYDTEVLEETFAMKSDDSDQSPTKFGDIILQNTSQTGGVLYNGYRYHKSGIEKKDTVYYRCAQKRKYECKATIQIGINGDVQMNGNNAHTHPAMDKPEHPLTGKKIYHKNFLFYRHSQTPSGIVRWRCSTKKCRSVVMTNSDVNDVLQAKNEHSLECVEKNC